MLLPNQSTGLRTIWLQKQGRKKKKIRHPLKLVYIDSFIVSLHRQPQLGNKVLPHEDWNNEKDFYFHLVCLLLLSICSIPLLTHRHELGKNGQPSPSSTSFDWLTLGVLIPNSLGRQIIWLNTFCTGIPWIGCLILTELSELRVKIRWNNFED